VHDNQVVRAKHFNGVIDLFYGTHAGGQDDRPSGFAVMTQKVIVRERSRSDLVAGRLELLDKIYRPFIPARGEPHDLVCPAMFIDLTVLVKIELKAALEIAIRVPERRFARFREFLGRIDDVYRPFLQLDRVAAGNDGGRNHLARYIYVAIVVDADFRDHETGLSVTNNTIADFHFVSHVASLLLFENRTKYNLFRTRIVRKHLLLNTLADGVEHRRMDLLNPRSHV
jgi:hypothetical protein